MEIVEIEVYFVEDQETKMFWVQTSISLSLRAVLLPFVFNCL